MRLAVEPVVDNVDELADVFVEPITTDITSDPTTVDSPSSPSLDVPTLQPDPFVQDTLMGEPTSPLADDLLYPADELLSVYIDGEFAGQTTSSPLFYSMGISRVDLTLQPDGGDRAVKLPRLDEQQQWCPERLTLQRLNPSCCRNLLCASIKI